MPYKLSEDGEAVMVKRGGRWVVLKDHHDKVKARKHLAALEINVEGHGTGNKPKRKPNKK